VSVDNCRVRTTKRRLRLQRPHLVIDEPYVRLSLSAGNDG